MRITLVSATNFEIQETIDKIPEWNLLKNIQLDHLTTGVGLVATTYMLTKYLQNNHTDLMIQAGIAGCFDQNIPLGSTFLVQNDVIADLGVFENNTWHDAFQLGLIKEDEWPWNNQKLKNNIHSFSFLPDIKCVDGVSVNEISTDPQIIKLIKDRFNPKIESMEGAAFHYTCLQEKIPFLQIRSVSNYIGERNKKNWLLKESVNNLNKILINYIKEIINKQS